MQLAIILLGFVVYCAVLTLFLKFFAFVGTCDREMKSMVTHHHPIHRHRNHSSRSKRNKIPRLRTA